MAGTAFGVLASTWLAIGAVLLASPPGSTSRALGLFLLLAGTAMLLTSSAAATGKLVPALVFAVAGVRFLLAALHQLTGWGAWETAAGVTGLSLAALALYGAWAAVLEDAVGATVLPLGRRGRGKLALEGGLLEQVKTVSTEGGVRQQL